MAVTGYKSRQSGAGFLALFVFARIQGIAPKGTARKLNP
jgi:hypothetical protein